MQRARLSVSPTADEKLPSLDPLMMEAAAEDEFASCLASSLSESQSQSPLLSQMAAEHFAGGGKRLRARLAWAAGRALEVAQAPTLLWAAACEILHNATLVHDDVQDGDTTRRGRPTVWVQHGVPQAINLGDWLFMRALATMDQATMLSASQQIALLRALRAGLETVIAGQVAECGFRGGPIVSPAAYSHMVRQKTAALFVLPVYGMAIARGMPEPEAKHLARAFDGLGEMFQWIDDVIDLYGDKGRDAPGQDLYEGKMSGLVVTYAAHHPSAAPWLKELLHRPREATSAEDVHKARSLFLQSNVLPLIGAHIDNIAAQAKAQCDVRLRSVHSALLAAIRAPLSALDADAKRVLHAD